MFGSRRGGTVIGNGLKIVGSVTAEGLVEVNGQVEGDLHCTSLIVSPTAQIVGSITAEQVVVDGKVEGRRCGAKVAGACRWRHSSPISYYWEGRLF